MKSRRFTVTEIIDPCIRCGGKKYVKTQNEEDFQNRLRAQSNRQGGLLTDQIEKLNAGSPNARVKLCPRCKGKGRYDVEADLQTALAEIYKGFIDGSRPIPTTINDFIGARARGIMESSITDFEEIKDALKKTGSERERTGSL